MKKSILILGHKGKVGSVLHKALSEQHDVTGYDDIDGDDATDFVSVLAAVQGKDVVIHAAYGSRENRGNVVGMDNVAMNANVLLATQRAGTPRVIVASSVHADDFEKLGATDALIETPGSMQPPSYYGTHKLVMEGFFEALAGSSKTEVVALRLGGVTADDSVKTEPAIEPQVWLSHADLSSAIVKVVEAPSVPGGYVVFNVVSNNSERIHATDNPFGWTPTSNSSDYLSEK